MVNGDDLYQVSCTVVDCGRNLPKSKRCIRWRFGIIDEEARSNGANGMDCKGKEYEVTLLWSVTSGKRLVQLNGTQVHFSRGKRTDGKFQVQWNDEELGMEFVVIAHAAPPIRARENWKQFELRCNSKSFDDMIPVCSLGVDSSPKNDRAALTSRVSEMKLPKKMDDPSGAKSDIEERIHRNSDSDAQSIPETELPKAVIESDDLSIVEDDNTDYLSDEIDEDRHASKSERFSQFEEEGFESIQETELPKAAIESDDLSIVEDDNTDYLSDEIDEDRPASKSERFSQFEEEGLGSIPETEFPKAVIESDDLSIVEDDNTDYLSDEIDEDRHASKSERFSQFEEEGLGSIPETEFPKAAIESDDLSIVEDDNTDYLSDEIDEDRPASKSERFSQFEEEGLDYDASADHASADHASEDDDDDDYDYDDDDISEDSLTSHLFECNWNDADDDEMNPNEPPSLAAIERGNTKAKKKDPLSYDQVWGKLDSKRNANKKYSHKSPTSVKDYEGYFKPKKERGFSPMRKIDLKSLSRKTPLGKDRSYSEV